MKILNAVIAAMLIAIAAAVAAVAAGGQPGPNPGPGPGLSSGGGNLGHPVTFDGNNTIGWFLMTAHERNEHRERMLRLQSYQQCIAYQEELRKAMEARAQDKGVALPTPKNNSCDGMKTE